MGPVPEPDPPAAAFSIRGPIAREDLPGLCDRVCAILRAHQASEIACDVRSVAPDAVTVDALARLQLAAQRSGCRVRLRNASRDVLELVSFMGLANVLRSDEFPGPGRLSSKTTTKEGPLMSNGARMIFPNLAVKDLERSVAFFTELGFTFDPRFTDENATAMVVNENAVVMLLTESFFQSFTTRALADPAKQVETMIAVSAASRADVDAVADKALEVGGAAANDPMEMDFMYGRSFLDPDGHHWEVVWMDMEAVDRAGTAAEAATS
jgi:predicted lactoylglutathione lyase/ABC-type transporter Mla MlaB component